MQKVKAVIDWQTTLSESYDLLPGVKRRVVDKVFHGTEVVLRRVKLHEMLRWIRDEVKKYAPS